jgi:hypothetical protein
VHSYKVIGDLPDEYFDAVGVSPGVETPTVVLYEREVSALAPSLRESEFDFQAAGGVPDWGTFGSLVWSVLT